ncbi:MAG: hypothetical protein WA629_05370 [Candidatus Aquilonibacter sp.]
MRKICLLLASLLLLGAAKSAAAMPTTNGSIAVAVVQLPEGAIIAGAASTAIAQLGTVSSNVRTTSPGVRIVRRATSYVVVTVIGLRATSSGALGTVALQAYLNAPIPGVSVRLDGIDLSTFPQVFAAHVPLNVVSRHQLELEIPNGMSPQLIPNQIPLEFQAQEE